MKIETIGDMREFMLQFPKDADSFPFVVALFEGDPL